MASEFVNGRGQRKTLADLIKQLQEGPTKVRDTQRTSPISSQLDRLRGNRVNNNKKTDREKRMRAAKEALNLLKF